MTSESLETRRKGPPMTQRPCLLSLPRRLSLTALLVSAALPAAAASPSPAEAIVSDWIAQVRQTGTTLSTGPTVYDAAHDTLALSDLTFSLPLPGDETLTATIRSLTVSGLTRDADHSLQASTIHCPGIDVRIAGKDKAGTTIHVGAVAGADISVPSLAGTTLDDAHPIRALVAAGRRLATLRIGSMSVGEIDAAIVTPQDRATVHYDGLTLTGIAQGSLQDLRSGKLVIGNTDATTGLSLTLGLLSVRGMSLIPYLDLLDDDAYSDGKGHPDWRPVLNGLDLVGFDFTTSGAHVAIAHMGLRDFKLRQFPEASGDLMERLITGPKTAASDDEGIELLLRWLDTYSYGSESLEGLSMSGPGLERFELGRLAIEGLSGHGIDAVSITGLDAAANGSTVKFGSMGLTGFSLPAFAAIRTAIAAEKAKPNSFDLFSILPKLKTLYLSDAMVREPKQGWVQLQSARLEMDGHVKSIPTRLRLDIDGFAVPTTLTGNTEDRQTFIDLGYPVLAMSLHAGLIWDVAAGILQFDHTDLTIDKGGTLSLTGGVGSIAPDLIDHLERLQTSWSGLTLLPIGLTYVDASLIHRIKLIAGRRLGVDPVQLKQVLRERAKALLPTVLEPATVERMTQQLAEFYDHPGTLSLSTSPAPVALTEIVGLALAAPQKLATRLGVELRASP